MEPQTDSTRPGARETTSTVASPSLPYDAVKEDGLKLLQGVATYLKEGRRPFYLSEDAADRLMVAFDALLDDALDDDGELDEERIPEMFEKVRLLRAFAGL